MPGRHREQAPQPGGAAVTEHRTRPTSEDRRKLAGTLHRIRMAEEVNGAIQAV
jgi:hypothetical protein